MSDKVFDDQFLAGCLAAFGNRITSIRQEAHMGDKRVVTTVCLAAPAVCQAMHVSHPASESTALAEEILRSTTAGPR